MSNERFGFQSAQQRQSKLDADAMCTQCGTVNPEGKLICRTCGNNLRDQRAIRAEADRILGGEAGGRPWLQKYGLLIGLAVTGLTLLVAALNAGPIFEMLMSSNAPAGAALWRGDDARSFDSMLKDLDAAVLDETQMRSAIAQPAADFTEDGVFVLAMDDGAGNMVPAGMALARKDNQRHLFVAHFGDSAEIRGVAQTRGQNLYSELGTAAAKYEGKYYDITGTATRDSGNRFTCVGRCDVQSQEEGTRRLYAYPVK
jgi:hypothetical protein